MGVLLQLADLSNARAIEIIDQNIDSITDRPTLLNAAASKGGVDVRTLLLRAVNSWGSNAGHPIERLHYVFGPEIAPDLRRIRADDPNDGVRRAIRTELVRLKDARAIAELREELIDSRVRSEEDAQHAIDVLSLASDCVDVAPDVGRLFRRVDESRSDVHRQLKQYAAGIALWLGDHDSAEHVIDLLGSRGVDYFHYPGLHSLMEILKAHTRQAFTRPEEWKAWWISTGHTAPLFTDHVSPSEEAAIINATIAWGRNAASGPFVREPIVYLQDDSKYLIDRERVWRELDADVRVYTASEIALLEKNPYSVLRIETNGERALATLGDGSNARNWRLKRLELAKQKSEWHVVRPAEGLLAVE